jgi:hypothetical protein
MGALTVLFKMEGTVLEEMVDSNCEPSAEEIEEYAKWIGMDLPEDNEFLYIAREGLQAPLAAPWKPCKTSTGEVYYFNFESAQSQWEHPSDEHYRELFHTAKAARDRRTSSGKGGSKSPLKSPAEEAKALDNLMEEYQKQKAALRAKLDQEVEDQALALKISQAEQEQKLKIEMQNYLLNYKEELRRQYQQQEQKERERLRLDAQTSLKSYHRDTELVMEREREALAQRLQQESQDLVQKERSRRVKEVEDLKLKYETERHRLQLELLEQQEIEDSHKREAAQLQDLLKRELEAEQKRLEQEFREEVSHTKQSLLRSVNADAELLKKLQLMKEEQDAMLEAQKEKLKALYDDQLRQEKERLRAENAKKFAEFREQTETQLEAAISQTKRQIEQQSKAEVKSILSKREQEFKQAADEQIGRVKAELFQSKKKEEEELRRSLLDLEAKLRDKEAKIMLKDRELEITRRAFDKHTRDQGYSDKPRHSRNLSTEELRSSHEDQVTLQAWKASLNSEKRELKRLQRQLEGDQLVWNKALADYYSHPDSGKKAELASVKRILDAQTKRLNERIRDLQNAERLVKHRVSSQEQSLLDLDEELPLSEVGEQSEDDESILERWRSKKTEKALEYRISGHKDLSQKLHLHSQKLSSYGRSDRESLSRQNSWLNALKEEDECVVRSSPLKMARPFLL